MADVVTSGALAKGGQLDLFDLFDAVAPPPEQVTRNGGSTGPGAAWRRTVTQWPDGSPVTWTAPWDCGDGTPAGTTSVAYRCPFCLQVEVSVIWLRNNHGVDYARPQTWQTSHPKAWATCTRQRLLASQAANALATGFPTYRCGHCRTHTSTLGDDLPNGPYHCAGERPEHAWRRVTEVPSASDR